MKRGALSKNGGVQVLGSKVIKDRRIVLDDGRDRSLGRGGSSSRTRRIVLEDGGDRLLGVLST